LLLLLLRTQICMEMDPGTFDAARLSEFLDIGLTRISMGVQVSVLRCTCSVYSGAQHYTICNVVLNDQRE
jgi:hypothetical protein